MSHSDESALPTLNDTYNCSNYLITTLNTESITVPSTHLIIATTFSLLTVGFSGAPPQIS